MITDSEILLKKAYENTYEYEQSPMDSNGICTGSWIKIKRADSRRFYSRWIPAKTAGRPLIVVLPGYDAKVQSMYPYEELIGSFNVLAVSPLGYGKEFEANMLLKHCNNFPVMFNTVFGKEEAYDEWLLDLMTAIRWAEENTQADCESLYFCGTSQGGGMSLVLGGIYSERCKALCADEPWLIGFSEKNLEYIISLSALYYPNEIVTYSEVSKRLQLVDPNTYAEKLIMPKLVMIGDKDTECSNDDIEEFYASLCEPKKFFCFENRPHGHNICFYEKMKEFFLSVENAGNGK